MALYTSFKWRAEVRPIGEVLGTATRCQELYYTTAAVEMKRLTFVIVEGCQEGCQAGWVYRILGGMIV